MSNSVATASKMHVFLKSPGALVFNINTRQVPSCFEAPARPHIFMHSISSADVWSRVYCERECIGVCVGLCYHGINHWSWAGGCCCSLHLSLSAGVRYFTLMTGRTERGEKKWAMLDSYEMDRKINAVVSKGRVSIMGVCEAMHGSRQFTYSNLHFCSACYWISSACMKYSVNQCWEIMLPM